MAKGKERVLGFFQKLGKAIMMPIAVVPIAGLLLRLGQPDVWGVNLFGGNGIPWMSAAGEAVMGQLPLFFAIGISIGLADENNGSAGLASAVGYYVMIKVASAFSVELYGINSSEKLDFGIIAGVAIGIIASYLYNRYKEVRLPQFLGFFGGRRFVPIVTSVVAIILGLIFGCVWPFIQGEISSFGKLIAGSGALGAFIFGVLNRALLPFGLHHVLNSMFWFQFGEYTDSFGAVWNGDVLRFMNGDPTAGVFLTGFFPIMMFALPAACLAMIFAANKEKRKNVIGLLGGMALTSFVTGITEPIEFSFMFLAPVLYIVHIIFTGLSMAITNILGLRHGFSFSAGLIDYIMNFRIAEKPVGLIAIGILFGVIYFIIFYLAIVKFNIKTPGRDIVENNIEEENNNSSECSGNRVSTRSIKLDMLANGIVEAVGGKRNIKDVDSCITRIRLRLKNESIVDRDKLKSLGATGIIKMGSNNIQIIIGTLADPIVSRMRKIRDKK